MKRPVCEYEKFGENKCNKNATHMVGLIHNDRFVLTCESHRESWQRRGNGWFIARLEGFCGNADNVLNDTLIDNNAVLEARRAGELSQAYDYQRKKLMTLMSNIDE